MSTRWVIASVLVLITAIILLFQQGVLVVNIPQAALLETSTPSPSATSFDSLQATLESFLANATGEIDYSLLYTLTPSASPFIVSTLTVTQTNPVTSTPSTRETNFLSFLQDAWLSGNPCAPPCWEELIPGETSLSQAMDLLSQNTLVIADSLEILIDQELDQATLTWQWDESTFLSAALFSGLEDDALLLAIQLKLGPGLLLADLEAAWGPPTHALLTEINRVSQGTLYLYQSYMIVWMDLGLVVHGVPADGLNLDGQFEVTAIRIFQPGGQGMLVVEGTAIADLNPWHGYDLGSEYRNP